MSQLLVLYQGTVVPPRYGTAKAVLEDARALAGRHQVTLLHRAGEDKLRAPATIDLVSSFRMPLFYGRFSTVLSLLYLPMIYRLCRRRRIEGVIIESVFLGWIGAVLRWLLGVRFGLRTHNIEGEKFRTLGKAGWRLLSWYEGKVLRSADQVFFISEQDRETAIFRYGVPESRTALVPYIIDTDAMRSLRMTGPQRASVKAGLGLEPDQTMLLFYGMLDYAPNVEALDLIESEVVSRLRAGPGFAGKVVVCGKGLDQGRRKRFTAPDSLIHYAGFVDDINEVIASADLVLNPILGGGGVKTKLIEAIALARPVVSTASGARGVDPRQCGAGLTVVEDGDWNAFVAAIQQQPAEMYDPPAAFYEVYSREGAAKIFEQGLGL
jgi:glycosyltransferase involved in cell wall biosynthesis